MKMDHAETTEHTELTAESVADYLARHPDFFMRRDALLSQLKLPHPCGGATSLLERQVALLRNKLADNQHNLDQLIDTARYNDKLFGNTRRLVLKLLEAQELDELAQGLANELSSVFGTDRCLLTLFKPVPGNASRLKIMTEHEQQLRLLSLLGEQPAVVTPFGADDMSFLLQEPVSRTGSAALVPLVWGETIGVLTIASYNPNHFRSDRGTLFVEFIGEVVTRLLVRLLPGA